MKYKVGDILRGEVNGREFQIVECANNHYVYKDLKTKRKFMVESKILDRCLVEKVTKEQEDV